MNSEQYQNIFNNVFFSFLIVLRHNKGAIKKLTASIKTEEVKVVELIKSAEASENSLPTLNHNVEALSAKLVKEEEKLEKLLEAGKAEVIYIYILTTF